MQTLEEWHPWYQSVSVIEPRAPAPHRPPGDPLLEAWDNRLAAQSVYFDRCVAKHIGRGHVVDEKNVAFLRVDQGLAKRAIEKAVLAFINDGGWPALTHREYLHLIVRVQLARKVLAAILHATPPGMVIRSQMPDLQNREHMIQWLLVDLWNLGGKAFLAAMAHDLPKKPAQSVSDNAQVAQLAIEPIN
jgi:hypothetical protein